MLAAETSVGPGCVALASRDGPIGVRELPADRRNAAGLFPAIDDLLRSAASKLRDISIYAYSCGPGSFTGLRVAATLGRMLQSAIGCNVIAVPTLTIIAQNAQEHPASPARVAVVRDAGSRRIYGGVFQRDGGFFRPELSPGLFCLRDFVATLGRPAWLAGDGLLVDPQAVVEPDFHLLDEPYWKPRIEWLVRLAWEEARRGYFCLSNQINVLYLRRPECEEVYEQRRAAARQRRGE